MTNAAHRPVCACGNAWPCPQAPPRGSLTTSQAAKIAAHESWAKTEDRTARTAPARAALDAKFLAQADGDPIRAQHLRKAHFARLALKSAQARRRKAEERAKDE